MHEHLSERKRNSVVIHNRKKHYNLNRQNVYFLQFFRNEKNSPTSGKGSTISQLGTDRKNMATFCMAVSVGKI